ncbi:hypothetical protein O3Q52_04030 [Streptomyces sp. ActVer]|uniref:hypothetical protein n=1 Tax=Streptomyces sp. ActVer TaxID=3014558 RepID=UPI0022B2B810|nr:hypothetical protein [Streptomyces sp. ActVer]MCZ4507388.1 hypothetical protein [Streptomyces sp. ActVer]
MIIVASSGKESRATDSAGTEVLPVAVETISESTEAALLMQMATSTRKDMDASLPEIVGHLNLLLGEDLGADEDEDVRELFRKGYRLIDLQNRPTAETPSFGVFIYLRDVADITRRLLWIYTQRHGLGAP